MNYVILALAIVFNATANIMMKVGITQVGKQTSLVKLAISAATHPTIIGGVSCFVVALGLYTFVLQKIDLSIAYPIMTSAGYVIVILASVLFLKEQLQMVQILGLALMITGVWLVAV